MFLRKIDGPRAVTLPDGSIMTRADLPDPQTRRWVASRKAAVVRAVQHGLLSVDSALEMYGLSDEELEHWCTMAERHGELALKATLLPLYRQP